MGFRFRKSKKILPGVRMNFGKKGVGIRFGGKRGGISFGPSGTRVSASIPGTGISYSSKLGGKKRKKTIKAKPAIKTVTKKINNKPVPLRTWYIVLAILFLVGGLGSFATNVSAAIVGIVIFVLMAFGTVIKFRAAKNAAQQKEEDVESENITI